MQINREGLMKGIKKVLPAIAKKELFDQADKLVFDDGNLVAYNDEISIIHPVQGIDHVQGAVDGRKLYDLLGRLPEFVNEIDLSVDGSELVVKAGDAKQRSSASFTISKAVLPISEIDEAEDFVDLPEGFMKSLRLVASTCARDMSRPVLTCVRFGKNVLEASDSFRAARMKLKADLPDLLLPVIAAELIAEDEEYGIDKIALGSRGEWVRFGTSTGTIICARLTSGTYPDLSNLYKIDGNDIVLPRVLRETLDRARVFSKRDHRIDEKVVIEMMPKRIRISAEYEGGRFSETVQDREQTAEANFQIHPDFLAEALLDESMRCVFDSQKIKFASKGWEHIVALR